MNNQAVSSGLCLQVLDRVPSAVLFADETGRILYANRPARIILERGEGLRSQCGRLAPTDPAAALALRKALKQCLCPEVSSTEVLALPRETGLPLLVRLSPAGRMGCFERKVGAEGLAIVFIGDPDNRPSPSSDLLQRLHGLTEREAALVGLLSLGRNLQESAREMAITYNTARDHLRSIMMKTQTSSQAQLLRLVWSSPAWPDEI